LIFGFGLILVLGISFWFFEAMDKFITISKVFWVKNIQALIFWPLQCMESRKIRRRVVWLFFKKIWCCLPGCAGPDEMGQAQQCLTFVFFFSNFFKLMLFYMFFSLFFINI
jgi:hypothetical protein